MVAFCAEFGHGAYLGGFQGLRRLLETDRRISNRITVDLARRRLRTDSGGHELPNQLPNATDGTAMIWSLHAMESKIQQLEGVLLSRRSEVAKMQRETADLDDRIQSRKAVLAKIESQLTINESKLQTAVTNMQNAVNELAKVKRHYKSVTSQNKVSVAVAKAESESLRLLILELKREQRKLDRTCELKNSIRSLDQLAAAALKLREDSAISEITTIESRLKVMESERKRVYDEIQAFQANHKALIDSQEGLLKVKKEALDNAEKSLKCLKDQQKKEEQTNNAKLEKLLSEQKMAAEEITELQTDKKRLQKEMNDLKAQVQTTNCEIRKVMIDLKKVQTELASAESRLDLFKTPESMAHFGMQTDYELTEKSTQSNETSEKTVTPPTEKLHHKSSNLRTPTTSDIVDTNLPNCLQLFDSSNIESGGAEKPETRNTTENNYSSNAYYRIEGMATEIVHRGNNSMKMTKYVTDVVLSDVNTGQTAASLDFLFLNLQEEVVRRKREACGEELYNLENQCAQIREHVEKEICRIVGIKHSVEKQAAKWETTMAKERKSQADTLSAIRADFLHRQDQAKEEFETSCKEYKRSLGKLKDEKARLTADIKELKIQLHKTRNELMESETQLEENILVISHHKAKSRDSKVEEWTSEIDYENNPRHFEDDNVPKASQSETTFHTFEGKPEQVYNLICTNHLEATTALEEDSPQLAVTRQAVIEEATDANQPPELSDLENNPAVELAGNVDSQIGAKPHDADRDTTAENVGYSDKEKLLILQRTRKRSWMTKKLP